MKIYRSTLKYIVGKYANLTIAGIESNDGSGPIASNVKYYDELHTYLRSYTRWRFLLESIMIIWNKSQLKELCQSEQYMKSLKSSKFHSIVINSELTRVLEIASAT